MTGRPRRAYGGSPRAGSVAQAQDSAAEVARAGRPGSGLSRGSDDVASASTANPDDVAMRDVMRRYDQLGDEPPRFNVADNDAAYNTEGAHTIDRHGPDIPLRRDTTGKTIEGRIYGDDPWQKSATASYKWVDPSTMNRELNRYVRENWTAIRSDLAVDEFHESTFDAGHRVGQGYYNKGMYGAGPREAEYGETSLVRVRIKVVAGSDPAEPFIVSAFPAGLG